MSTLDSLANNKPIELNQHQEPLTLDELKEAKKELIVKQKYPKAERRYADKPINLQQFGCFSFVPSADAKPDKNGIFGFAKMRGNFATEIEASEHAESLIRNQDSYNKIFIAPVGRPFPITTSSDFSKEINEVQLQKEMMDTYSKDVKEKREKEAQDMEVIKEREKNLTAEVKKENENSDELYTTLQVKRAQLIWTYVETQKKLKTMKESITKTREQIAEYDLTEPTLKDLYYQKYLDARRSAGLPSEDDQNNFIKYMLNDIEPELGF